MKWDGKVTAALIFAVVLETTAGLIWAGAAAERLSTVETTIYEQRPLSERMARMEAELSALRGQLERIENKLDEV